MAHIFELTQEFIVLSLGIKIGYSNPYTLTDSSTAIMPGQRGDMSILKPTVMAAVPLILDRIYKSLRSKIGEKGRSFQELFDYFVDYRIFWMKKGYNTPLLNHLLFGKPRDLFGGQLKVSLLLLENLTDHPIKARDEKGKKQMRPAIFQLYPFLFGIAIP